LENKKANKSELLSLKDIRDTLNKHDDEIAKLKSSKGGNQGISPEMINNINNKIAGLENRVNGIMGDTRINDLNDKFTNLSEELKRFQNDVLKWLKDMQDMINSKADIDQLMQL
jgi:archaellum component FlaC